MSTEIRIDDTDYPIGDAVAEYIAELETQLSKAKALIRHADDKHAELQAELAYIEEPKYCKSCKSRCVFEGYEAGLLVFVCIKCGSKLWYNASSETLTMPIITCPKCGYEFEDFDGFGFIYCEKCHHCTHPNSMDGICGICGRKIEEIK